ncbi:MAG: hypothetical protein KJ666_10735 [Bacteroidetes bacterium]|nr:hypothetical protein [Bacteroidota bacterium]
MRVYLSAKGVELVQRLNGDYIDIHKEIFAYIDIEQHKPLINAMTHLL